MITCTKVFTRSYLSPDDVQRHAHVHVIGQCSRSPLFEVAVPSYILPGWSRPSYTSLIWPDCGSPHIPSISIDSLIHPREMCALGYQVAHTRALYGFLNQAQEGIAHHGTELAAYYRVHYPFLIPWIEYLVLLHDLPPAEVLPGHQVTTTRLRQDFSQAVVFLSMLLTRSDDKAAARFMAMSSQQVIFQLRASLETEYRGVQPSPRRLALVRDVLVKVGGARSEEQLKLNPDKGIELAAGFYAFMGGREDLEPVYSIPGLLEKAARSRVFQGYNVNLDFIQRLAGNLGILIRAEEIDKAIDGIEHD